MANCYKVAPCSTGWLSPLNEYGTDVNWQGEGLAQNALLGYLIFLLRRGEVG